MKAIAVLPSNLEKISRFEKGFLNQEKEVFEFQEEGYSMRLCTHFDPGGNFSFSHYQLQAFKDIKITSQNLLNGHYFLQFNLGEAYVKYNDCGCSQKIMPNSLWIGYSGREPSINAEFKKGKNYQSIFFLFTKRFFEKIFPDFDGRHYQNDLRIAFRKITPRCHAVSLGIIDTLKQSGSLNWLLAQSKILELLFLLKQEGVEPLRSEAYKARDILLKNLKSPPSTQELARACFTNQTRLKQVFKSTFGLNLHEFVIKERMRMAKGLLLDKELSISEVASLVGYYNCSHFTKMYKRTYGKLPSQRSHEGHEGHGKHDKHGKHEEQDSGAAAGNMGGKEFMLRHMASFAHSE